MSDRLKKTRRIGKHPNALQHGVFTSVAILPGEHPREFAALLLSLIEEWEPMGPTENDAVVTIANGMWRKARLQKFLRAKILECKFDASHPAYDEPLRSVLLLSWHQTALTNFSAVLFSLKSERNISKENSHQKISRLS
jgi:hypothetical protein